MKLPSNGLTTDDRRNCLPKALLNDRPPGQEVETQTVVEHGEASTGKKDASTIDAGSLLAFAQRTVGLSWLTLRLSNPLKDEERSSAAASEGIQRWSRRTTGR